MNSVEWVLKEFYLKPIHKCLNLDLNKILQGFEKFERDKNLKTKRIDYELQGR